MKKTTYFLFVLAFSILLASCGNKGEKYDLAYRFQNESVYEVYFNSTYQLNQTMMGEVMQNETTMENWYDWKVNSVDKDSTYTVDVTQQKLNSKISVNDSVMIYDSMLLNEELSEEDRMIFAMIGKTFQMKMKKSGVIDEINGVEEYMKSVYQVDESSKIMGSDMVQKFSNESMKGTFAPLTIYPNKAVKVGESWKSTTSLDMGMSFDTENKFTLQSVEDNIATIETVGDVKSSKSKSKDKGLMGMIGSMMEISGSQNGFIKVDVRTGEILTSQIDIDFNATINLFGMKMPLSMKGTNLYRLTKKA